MITLLKNGEVYAPECQRRCDLLINEICIALEKDIPVECLSMSSDAYGCKPIFDDEGNFMDMSYFSSLVLCENFKSMILDEPIPLNDALRIVSSIVATRMGLEFLKGHFRFGWDINIVFMNRDYSIHGAFCKRKEMVAIKE